MRTPVALLNLWHERAKTLVSIGGVAFALLLVFAQLGFMGAVSYTATNIFSNLKFDLLLRSPNYVHLYEPGSIPQADLHLAAGIQGVQTVAPFWITVNNWRRLDDVAQTLPETDLQAVAIMGLDPNDDVFVPADINQLIRAGSLSTGQDLIIDNFTQVPFGPRDGQRFGTLDIGTEAEIGNHRFRVAGVYRLGTGLAANGSVITSQAGFTRILPWIGRDAASLGLVTVADDQDVERVRAALVDRFRLLNTQRDDQNTSVAVLTRDEALGAEKHRWLWQTPIGLIFQLGVVISLFVGAAIVYMVLATDVTDRLPEYATLLAVGYSRVYLARLVMTQAVVLAIIGFITAWFLAELLYRLATRFSGIPMSMDPWRIIIVFCLGIAMCSFSGLLALRKLWKAEPANLF